MHINKVTRLWRNIQDTQQHKINFIEKYIQKIREKTLVHEDTHEKGMIKKDKSL